VEPIVVRKADAAIAVFVKTPGMSPVKTRLAQALGRERAEEFFRLSVAAVEETLLAVANSIDCEIYWAVAEEEAMTEACWKWFPRICQGGGALGDRVHRVLSELRSRHSAVLAIGADTPQLTSQLLISAIDTVMVPPYQPSHVIGRCRDGGFYLFGTNVQVAESAWDAIPWGEPGAAATLVEQLDGCGTCHELRLLSDVDEAEDLPFLCHELVEVAALTPCQQAVLRWALNTSSGRRPA